MFRLQYFEVESTSNLLVVPWGTILYGYLDLSKAIHVQTHHSTKSKENIRNRLHNTNFLKIGSWSHWIISSMVVYSGHGSMWAFTVHGIPTLHRFGGWHPVLEANAQVWKEQIPLHSPNFPVSDVMVDGKCCDTIGVKTVAVNLDRSKSCNYEEDSWFGWGVVSDLGSTITCFKQWWLWWSTEQRNDSYQSLRSRVEIGEQDKRVFSQ